MAKTILDPKEIFSEFVADFQSIYGEHLISVILYGSAAGKDYRPGKSDINFMIVLSQDGINRLENAFPLIKKWQKKNVAIPLFLTENYIKTSLDVFPIEYLNFKQQYILAHGQDILKDLSFDPELVRLQCEREIKGKLLLLREAFLESSGKGGPLKNIIKNSLPAFMAIFEALLFLKEKEVPNQKTELVQNICRAFDMDSAVFEQLLDIRGERIKLSDNEMLTCFKKYLTEVQKLAMNVDALGG